MQNHETSAFIQFIRAGILLFALIAVPGIAVCWNFLPKDCFNGDFLNGKSFDNKIFNSGKPEQNNNLGVSPLQPKKMPMSKVSEDENDKIPELPALPDDPFNNRFANLPAVNIERIKPAVGDMNDGTAEASIPAAFVPSPAEWASANASNVQIENIQTAAEQSAAGQINTAYSEPVPLPDIPQQNRISFPAPAADYPALEKELNALGAKYYRLEKWGRQSDLFRFSCYVSPNSGATYQKYFQAIDADEIRVMQRVVNEIKQWKNNVDVK